MSNKHSKLCTPVSEVVNTQDVVTHKLKQTSDTVTDDSGPKTQPQSRQDIVNHKLKQTSDTITDDGGPKTHPETSPFIKGMTNCFCSIFL